MLPIKFRQLLRKREGMFVGLAALIPSKIQLNYLEEDERPKSNDISFIKGWQNEVYDDKQQIGRAHV